MNLRERLAALPTAPAPVYAEDDDYPGACSACGARWKGERPAHCTVCHLTFGGDGGFDAHRVGRHTPPERRCLTTQELTVKGYSPNHRGHWRIPRPPESIPRQVS